MVVNSRNAAGSSGARRSTSRYSFSALSYCSAARAASARDRSCSLVASFLEQAAFASTRHSASVNRQCMERMVPILDATGAMQVEGVVLVMESCQSKGSAVIDGCGPQLRTQLALGARLFNGNCVTTPKGLPQALMFNFEECKVGC